MMRNLYICIFLLFNLSFIQDSNENRINNPSFKNGEKISFNVYYSLWGVYVHAGTAFFEVNLKNYKNKMVYHLLAEGRSNKGYDWIFKVRDVYQSYIDTSTFLPYYFERKVEEGRYKKFETIEFNRNQLQVISKGGAQVVPKDIHDVLSAVFFIRNFNFNKLKYNELYPLQFFIDDKVNDSYIRYLGKEIIVTKYGKFKAIKFKPLLLHGNMFKGGEKMSVWVTDDENHIPIRIETEISVGSIKIDMIDYKNLKYPLSSQIK